MAGASRTPRPLSAGDRAPVRLGTTPDGELPGITRPAERNTDPPELQDTLDI